MGINQSKTRTSDENIDYQELQQLEEAPGHPTLIRDKVKQRLAEMYKIKLYDQDKHEQQRNYLKRKQYHKNIVSIYHYLSNKECMDCIKDKETFTIISEHIPYRLLNFTNLSISEGIYIFYQSLLGYQEIFKYGKLCYPTSSSIGVTEQSGIKVWVNENWADNSCRKAKNEILSIQQLWNVIADHVSSAELEGFNRNFYSLQNKSYNRVLQFIRNNYLRVINQGRFRLQEKIIDKKQSNHFNGQKRFQNTNLQYRAYSQGGKRAVPHISKANSLQNYSSYPHSFKPNQVDKQKSDPYYRQIPKYSFTPMSKITNNPGKLSPNFPYFQSGRSIAQQNQVYHRNVEMKTPKAQQKPRIIQPKARNVSPFVRNIEPKYNFQPDYHKIGVSSHERPKQLVNPSRVHFFYNTFDNKQRNQDYRAVNKISQHSSYHIHRAQEPIQPKSKNSSVHFCYNDLRPRQKITPKKPFQIGKQPTIQPFQLQLQLQGILSKQQNSQCESQTLRNHTEKIQRITEHRTQRTTEQERQSGFIRQIQSLEQIRRNSDAYLSPQPKNSQDQEKEESDSKLAAQQFKFYLRSSQIPQQMLLISPRESEPKNTSRCIIERWDEEQSFSHS